MIRIMGRIFLLLFIGAVIGALGVGFACILSWLIGCGNEAAGWVTSALSIAAIIATFKEMLQRSSTLFAYIREGAPQVLWELMAYFLAMVTTLALAILLDKCPKVDDQALSAHPVVVFVQPCSGSGAKIGGPQRDTSALVLSIPFLEEAQQCVDQKTFCQGVEVDDASQHFIQQIAVGLNSCSVPGSRVRIEVRGFSSSSHFGKLPREVSNELNKRVAEERAQNVAALIREHAPQLGTSTVPRIWSSYEEMAHTAHFNDSIGDAFSAPRGLLNRRVEIRILSAGDCAVHLIAPGKEDMVKHGETD